MYVYLHNNYSEGYYLKELKSSQLWKVFTIILLSTYITHSHPQTAYLYIVYIDKCNSSPKFTAANQSTVSAKDCINYNIMIHEQQILQCLL